MNPPVYADPNSSTAPKHSEHVVVELATPDKTPDAALAPHTGEPPTFDELYASRCAWWKVGSFPCTRWMIRAIPKLSCKGACKPDVPSWTWCVRIVFWPLAPIFALMFVGFCLALDIVMFALWWGCTAGLILPFSAAFGFALCCSQSLQIDTRRKFVFHFTFAVVVFILLACFALWVVLAVFEPAAACGVCAGLCVSLRSKRNNSTSNSNSTPTGDVSEESASTRLVTTPPS